MPTKADVRARLAARLERELRAAAAEIDAATERLDALYLRKSELRASLDRLRTQRGKA